MCSSWCAEVSSVSEVWVSGVSRRVKVEGEVGIYVAESGRYEIGYRDGFHRMRWEVVGDDLEYAREVRASRLTAAAADRLTAPPHQWPARAQVREYPPFEACCPVCRETRVVQGNPSPRLYPKDEAGVRWRCCHGCKAASRSESPKYGRNRQMVTGKSASDMMPGTVKHFGP